MRYRSPGGTAMPSCQVIDQGSTPGAHTAQALGVGKMHLSLCSRMQNLRTVTLPTPGLHAMFCHVEATSGPSLIARFLKSNTTTEWRNSLPLYHISVTSKDLAG
jgi:hypothetical protein